MKLTWRTSNRVYGFYGPDLFVPVYQSVCFKISPLSYWIGHTFNWILSIVCYLLFYIYRFLSRPDIAGKKRQKTVVIESIFYHLSSKIPNFAWFGKDFLRWTRDPPPSLILRQINNKANVREPTPSPFSIYLVQIWELLLVSRYLLLARNPLVF